MQTASAPPRGGAPVRVVTDAEVVARLRAGVAAAGSQRAYAAAAGLHGPGLCQVLRGRQAPAASHLRAVGVERALVVRDEAPAAGEDASCS
ncbi:transcriptional regulator [Methylobacterium planeticum]|uniref:Transcriptional regulator n=1 Tax=Methylobacterium planeticum TaxID=2615211 RepID=A0A6N6MLI2_9HYPH|nr:transcriptional regulator [Methylobacterium planeticum]KAB1071157.1 transcriptional regulator [Methylobacterium planeticum]